jgi:hypothetical protein
MNSRNSKEFKELQEFKNLCATESPFAVNLEIIANMTLISSSLT